jgi:transposase
MARTMSVLGIDIAKLVFHVVGMDDTGHVVLRKRLARSKLQHFIATLPPLRIGMEACGSAHDWARCFREHGHDVRLIAPQFIKASRRRSTRPAMRKRSVKPSPGPRCALSRSHGSSNKTSRPSIACGSGS